MTISAPRFALLVEFVMQRELLRMNRALGEPKPWTDDPILAKGHFCNVRREDDYGTRWIDEHIRKPFAKHRYLWFMLCIARVTNWPETLDELIRTPGAWPDADNFDLRILAGVLRDRAARDEKVFADDAYTITPGGRKGPKYHYIVDVVLANLWLDRQKFGAWFSSARPTLEGTVKLLQQYEGWGPFMAYQATVDMRFTPLLRNAPDIGTFAAAGPGTKRGLNRLHERPPVKTAPGDAQALREMRELDHRLREELPEIPFDFSDIPNILCEFDKWMRAREGGKLRLYKPRSARSSGQRRSPESRGHSTKLQAF